MPSHPNPIQSKSTPRTFMLNHACLNCMANVNNNSKKITINLKEKEDVKSVTMKISK